MQNDSLSFKFSVGTDARNQTIENMWLKGWSITIVKKEAIGNDMK